MTQNETYAAFAVIALIAYAMGMQSRKTADAVTSYDPLGWLNQYTTA